jgi:ATP-dependent Clp protease ATP-binding subunit ClpC
MSAQNPFEKFTEDAKLALKQSEKIGKEMKVPCIGTEILLLAILQNQGGIAFSILNGFGVSQENVENLLPSIRLEKSDPNFPSTLSIYFREAVERAVDISHAMKHNFIGSEHLLLAMIREEKSNASIILKNMSIVLSALDKQISQTLNQLSPSNKKKKFQKNPFEELLDGLSGAIGIMNKEDIFDEPSPYKKKRKKRSDKNSADNSPNANKGKKDNDEESENRDEDENEYDEIEEMMRGEEMFFADEESDSDSPALDFFSTDFTKMAEEGEIDSIIGRDKEIERVIHILNRKTKNNPVLIGEPGVGKTAVAEGLAKAIVDGNVPTGIMGKRVLSLDIGAMIAGTKYRGEFEDRLKEVISEAIDSAGDIIIFIDELHTIVGAGSAEGTLDAANIMKPALSRGKVQVIGATTFDEYRSHIEKDKALERRFQPVTIEEPSVDDAIQIMSGIKTSFEKFHRLNIKDSAIETSVRLSKRFIPDRFLPDKAIDILDESCAGKGHKSQKKTEEMKKIEEKYKTINKKKEEAVKNQNYEKALKHKNKAENYKKELKKLQDNVSKQTHRVSISDRDIEKTIAKITGIPLEKLASDDTKKLLSLEKTLESRVIGQEKAIEEISKSIRRSRAGISNPNRPIGTFLFLGPTGVGKTELVRVLAEEVFGKSENLIKIDMSEFMEKHSTSRLVGATAGYVGYEDGGELTEKVRRKPYSIVLFDEIEKAHTDFQNILLQIFEDGFLTDAKGRKIDFRNTVIILTSNIGADILTEEAVKIGFTTKGDDLQKAEEDFESKTQMVLEQVKKHFKPEFLGRLDTTVVFKPLTKESIKKIVEINLHDFEKRLELKKIKISYTDEVIEFLAKKSFDSKSGGRKVRKIVREEVEDLITDALLSKEIKENTEAKISLSQKKGSDKIKKKEEEEFLTIEASKIIETEAPEEKLEEKPKKKTPAKKPAKKKKVTGSEA